MLLEVAIQRELLLIPAEVANDQDNIRSRLSCLRYVVARNLQDQDCF